MTAHLYYVTGIESEYPVGHPTEEEAARMPNRNLADALDASRFSQSIGAHAMRLEAAKRLRALSEIGPEGS